MHDAEHKQSQPRDTLLNAHHVATDSTESQSSRSQLRPHESRHSIASKHAKETHRHSSHRQSTHDGTMQVHHVLPHENEECIEPRRPCSHHRASRVKKAVVRAHEPCPDWHNHHENK